MQTGWFSAKLSCKISAIDEVAGEARSMRNHFWSALLICSVLAHSGSRAQTGKTYPTVTKRSTSLTNAPIRQISEDVFQIGLAKVNKRERSVSFPATINMSSNLIEFVCDGGDTKLHESLLRTESSPLHIHLAALLLSKKGPETNSATNSEPVDITVSWDNAAKKADLEELIRKRDPKGQDQAKMPKGNWIYTGWNQYGGKMPSEISGVIIALLGDSTALINSKDQDHENDEIWFINENKTPKVGTSVEITLRFK